MRKRTVRDQLHSIARSPLDPVLPEAPLTLPPRQVTAADRLRGRSQWNERRRKRRDAHRAGAHNRFLNPLQWN